MNELWTRLVDKSKQDQRASLSQKEFQKILAEFKLDTGLSERTVVDYVSILRSMGAITDNWYYISTRYMEEGDFERLFRFLINLGFKMPNDVKGI